MPDPNDLDLLQLAERLGIQTEFYDGNGVKHTISRVDLIHSIQALGLPGANIAVSKYIEQQAAIGDYRRVLPPVVFANTGQAEHSIDIYWRIDWPTEGWFMLIVPEGGLPGRYTLQVLQPDYETPLRESAFFFKIHVDLVWTLPPGYHDLSLHHVDLPGLQASCRFIVAPKSAYIPPELEVESSPMLPDQNDIHAIDSNTKPARLAWRGLGLQLYTLCSLQNCGSGEFYDLPDLMDNLVAQGYHYDFVALNPLHTRLPDADQRSPYSPSHRCYLYPGYLRPQAMPGLSDEMRQEFIHQIAKQHLNSKQTDSISELNLPEPAQQPLPGEQIFFPDYFPDRVKQPPHPDLLCLSAAYHFRSKLLRLAFEEFYTEHWLRGSRYARSLQIFRDSGGQNLYRLCLHDALYCFFVDRKDPLYGFKAWPLAYQNPMAPAVQNFARDKFKEILYFYYLYWASARQYRNMQRRLLRRSIRLNLDLAVGVIAQGAEVWSSPDLFAREVEIGAPPDAFAPGGQRWGLAPFDPHKLRRAAYEPFVNILRSNMPRGGVIRMDHIMQLFRLYFACKDGGAYVRYPAEQLLAILCLESWRRRCMVVGEDLGTVAAGVREELARRKILSSRVLYFEKEGSEFILPEAYPRLAIVSLNTHDLATLAGFVTGLDIRMRLRAIGDFSCWKAQSESRLQEIDALIHTLLKTNCIAEAEAQDWGIKLKQLFGCAGLEADGYSIVKKLYKALMNYLSKSPAVLQLENLQDLNLEIWPINCPADLQYPSWQLPGSMPINPICNI